jgi:small-conductance mechanosensitive channel
MKIQMSHALTYAGALPFIAAAGLCLVRVETLPLAGSVQTLATSYGLVIVSFMAGVHWGQMRSGKSGALNLFVTSNTAALAAWFAFLLLPAAWFYGALILLFATLYGIDRLLHSEAHLSHGDLRVRGAVTAIVCASLMVLAVHSAVQ